MLGMLSLILAVAWVLAVSTLGATTGPVHLLLLLAAALFVAHMLMLPPRSPLEPPVPPTPSIR